ncbi:MAG: hypothetical protein ACRDRR_17790 [Pseudonocardiaceae bacterium]
MSVDNPDELMHAVLPAALEVLNAWSIAETEADPSVFHQAMDRTIGDAVSARDPMRGLAEMIFGLSSLSGILLDELAGVTGRSRGEVLHAVHRRYLGPGVGPPR